MTPLTKVAARDVHTAFLASLNGAFASSFFTKSMIASYTLVLLIDSPVAV